MKPIGSMRNKPIEVSDSVWYRDHHSAAFSVRGQVLKVMGEIFTVSLEDGRIVNVGRGQLWKIT